MAEKPRKRSTPTVLRSAGRTALAMLRQTRQRAKLGTLHLPLDLHPLRQQTILLPPAAPDFPPVAHPGEPPATAAPATHERGPHARPGEETRALRGRLGMLERRVVRLRQALEQERHARAQAGAALAQPHVMIDHLVADLGQVDTGDGEALRQAITQVLGAYGFAISEGRAPDPESARYPLDDSTPPAVPGWERRRLLAAIEQILTSRPQTDRRSIALGLKALVRHRAVTPVLVAGEAGLTSALARHRLRVALDSLCVAGIARHDGQSFMLVVQQEPGARRGRRK